MLMVDNSYSKGAAYYIYLREVSLQSCNSLLHLMPWAEIYTDVVLFAGDISPEELFNMFFGGGFSSGKSRVRIELLRHGYFHLSISYFKSKGCFKVILLTFLCHANREIDTFGRCI